MVYNGNLNKLQGQVSCIRYDLHEGEISIKDAIIKLEKISNYADNVVKQYEEKHVGLALKWQELEITARLFVELLKTKI